MGMKDCDEVCSVLRTYNQCYLPLVCFGVLVMNPGPHCAWDTPLLSSTHYILGLNFILALQ